MDRDGALGAGEQLVAQLSPGLHTLTLVATSSTGSSAAASIQVNVEPDGDSDGIPDTYLTAHPCLGTLKSATDLDPDTDGLSTYAEWQLGTNPCTGDSDQDGTGDGDEVALGSRPLDAGSLPMASQLIPAADWVDLGNCSVGATHQVDVRTVDSDVAWSLFTTANWIVAAGGSEGSGNVTIHADCQGFGPGIYTGQVVLVSADGESHTIDVTVSQTMAASKTFLPLVRQ